jgi:L-2-hydroxycarboxylate dehydrogenase (NAD+)
MPAPFRIVPVNLHDALVTTAYQKRGYSEDEARDAARICASAARHGIRTHNALKALHLDELLGSGGKGCVPRAEIRELPHRFTAVKRWDAQRKFGPSVAFRAMEEATRLADIHGCGTVVVDNAFHYLWGGGFVLDVAQRGYLGYTNCTSALAEVVPFGGKFPTLGTNPHSWGFPTTDAIGFPIVIDWATSVIAMGRVQQLKREGLRLPPDAAVDASGKVTQDPAQAAALLPFGAHKGYGLALIDELVSGLIGGSLPTTRGRWAEDGDKHTATFFFQVIHPEAMSGGAFARGRSQSENVKAVIKDILGHGNEHCLLPGEPEARFAKKSQAAGGLLFTDAEIEEFSHLATSCGQPAWKVSDFPTVPPELS